MLGYLDDVIIVPPGILLAIRLMPPILTAELSGAATRQLNRPTSRWGVAFILVVWLAAAGLLLRWLWPNIPLRSW